jgi:hypothetical protein
MALPSLRGYSRPGDSRESFAAPFPAFTPREERGIDFQVQAMDASLAGACLTALYLWCQALTFDKMIAEC